VGRWSAATAARSARSTTYWWTPRPCGSAIWTWSSTTSWSPALRWCRGRPAWSAPTPRRAWRGPARCSTPATAAQRSTTSWSRSAWPLWTRTTTGFAWRASTRRTSSSCRPMTTRHSAASTSPACGGTSATTIRRPPSAMTTPASFMTRSVSTLPVAGGAASSEATSSTWVLRLPRGTHLFYRRSPDTCPPYLRTAVNCRRPRTAFPNPNLLICNYLALPPSVASALLLQRDAMIEETGAMDQVLPRQRGLSRRAKLLLAAAGALIVALVLLWPVVRRWSRAERSVDLARLQVATVVRGDLERDVAAQGRIVAANHPKLYSP